jgi:DNA repair protein RecN (Recombination protein N)
MLKRLSVSNLAVVEKVVVDFDPSLNVITGETGAGKSVLMGALELVLGGRADASVVRDGAKEAEVEADFGDRVVRRTVTREGRSRAWVNDESVSVAELKELGRALVDIHGPTANQKLVEESFQRETLDALGKTRAASDAYAKEWTAYSAILADIAALASGGSEDEADLLRFQIGELEGANLTDDDETVAERHAAAAHAEEIVENANAITEALGGDPSVSAILADLQPKFRAIARHLPQAEAWSQEADDVAVRVQELSRTIADAVSALDVGEEDFAALDARLTLVNRLKRKFRVETVAALVELLAQKKDRLAAIENRDERLAELNAKKAAAEKDLKVAGAALTKARAAAGEKLGKSVTKELKDLGFLRAKFFVSLEPQEPDATGCDRVVYMFEPNPGESARPLAAIASSGEIARVMLALKTVTAASGAPHQAQGTSHQAQSTKHKAPGTSHQAQSTSHQAQGTPSTTLVFDEIDANIGGEVGRVVGEKMRAVAKTHQVIAITHLPQSAVFGARHLVVSKHVADGRTRTTISAVEGDARVSEIARMLGGENLTSVVRKHAQELLQLSR